MGSPRLPGRFYVVGPGISAGGSLPHDPRCVSVGVGIVFVVVGHGRIVSIFQIPFPAGQLRHWPTGMAVHPANRAKVMLLNSRRCDTKRDLCLGINVDLECSMIAAIALLGLHPPSLSR